MSCTWVSSSATHSFPFDIDIEIGTAADSQREMLEEFQTAGRAYARPLLKRCESTRQLHPSTRAPHAPRVLLAPLKGCLSPLFKTRLRREYLSLSYPRGSLLCSVFARFSSVFAQLSGPGQIPSNGVRTVNARGTNHGLFDG